MKATWMVCVLVLFWATLVSGEEKYFEKMKTFTLPETQQGVAVDETHFYVVGQRHIAKYDKKTGALVKQWMEEEGAPISHLQSGVIVDGMLVCSHSNEGGVPLTSSVEIWDADTLEHIESHSFGIIYGACVWIDRHVGYWWVTFRSQQDGQSFTTLVKMDDHWRVLESWIYPDVMHQVSVANYSGGSWGPDHKLYVTAHDQQEVYVMQIPKRGSVLELVEKLDMDNKGQGLAWDRTDPCMLYTIAGNVQEVGVHWLRR